MYMPYLMIKVLTDMLTYNIVSFEKLGPGIFLFLLCLQLWALIKLVS